MNNNQLFKQAVKGNNIMTPEFIRYARTPNHVIELTKGQGMDGEDIYGVTVVNIEGEPTHDHEKSQMFFSREFAEAYIADIK